MFTPIISPPRMDKPEVNDINPHTLQKEMEEAIPVEEPKKRVVYVTATATNNTSYMFHVNGLFPQKHASAQVPPQEDVKIDPIEEAKRKEAQKIRDEHYHHAFHFVLKETVDRLRQKGLAHPLLKTFGGLSLFGFVHLFNRMRETILVDQSWKLNPDPVFAKTIHDSTVALSTSPLISLSLGLAALLGCGMLLASGTDILKFFMKILKIDQKTKLYHHHPEVLEQQKDTEIKIPALDELLNISWKIRDTTSPKNAKLFADEILAIEALVQSDSDCLKDLTIQTQIRHMVETLNTYLELKPKVRETIIMSNKLTPFQMTLNAVSTMKDAIEQRIQELEIKDAHGILVQTNFIEESYKPKQELLL